MKSRALDRDQTRTTSETHPWINFSLSLDQLPHTLWMLIGEARSKCEHLAGVPLRPATAQQLYDVYLSKGVHATTSIEGNTLSEEQVRQQIHKKLTLPRSQEYMKTEVQNILDACHEIAGDVLQNAAIAITPERIRHFNGLALRGLDVGEDVEPGEFRTHSVGVMGYRGAPWAECPALVDRLCRWLNQDFETADPDLKFAMVLFKAVVAHLYIARIHPFGDGNGRTARLIEFQVLVQSGLVPFPAGHLLSNHYNKTRSRYYLELDRSSKAANGVTSFLQYAIEGFVDGLREQLDLVRSQQWEVAWENYVHDQFQGSETPASTRQKHLILDMPAGVTSKKDLRDISPRVARDYAGKTDKTLTRDLNSLEEMGLIGRRDHGFYPNRDLILAFLPPGARTRLRSRADRFLDSLRQSLSRRQ